MHGLCSVGQANRRITLFYICSGFKQALPASSGAPEEVPTEAMENFAGSRVEGANTKRRRA